MTQTTVTLIGLGHVGLPTAALLCGAGLHVHGVDINTALLAALRERRLRVEEPGLADVLWPALDGGRLTLASTPVPADVFVLAVPTPIDAAQRPDLAALESAVAAIAPVLRPGNLILIESTSPVGTTARLHAQLLGLRPELAGAGLQLAYCPERVLPGSALRELIHNDRVIGGVDAASTEAALAFYRHFAKGECVLTTARVAEAVKLAENTFRDVNIALANELEQLCETLEVPVREVIRLANRHPRVHLLSPGPGVGGHCIAVDPWFLIDADREAAALMRTARAVNDAKPGRVIARVLSAATQYPAGLPAVAVFGLSYKPDVDDLRESPALAVAVGLCAALRDGRLPARRLLVVEPNLEQLPAVLAGPDVALVNSDTALAEAPLVVLLVNHRDFAAITPARLAAHGVIDVCGLLEPIA